MSFDNKMIIDATRGTIARFVNHSCEPNCEMIKWTVGGEPRMALFAGRRGIMTGEELTYDYNFEYVFKPPPPITANTCSPFSTKNIQECHCGTRSCRGVLGPKPKKPLPSADESFLSTSSQIIAGTKRKLAEMFGKSRGSESAPNSPRKRFMANSAMTKARNALAKTEAEREKAEKEATALAAQIASRENRAMKRGNPMTSSRRRQGKGIITSTRQATYNIRRGKIQHKVPRAGALKKPSAILRRKAALANEKAKNVKYVKKGVPPPKPTRKIQRGTTPEASEDESPNITPASLRSANKLKPIPVSTDSSVERDSMEMSSSDSDDEEGAGLELAMSNIRGRKRGDAPAPRDIHKTGARVSKRVRNDKGLFVKK
jgi:palmitoyltransferase ZDHHC9/14/18